MEFLKLVSIGNIPMNLSLYFYFLTQIESLNLDLKWKIYDQDTNFLL